MIDFVDKLKKNANEIDSFLDNHLPFGIGLNKKLFE